MNNFVAPFDKMGLVIEELLSNLMLRIKSYIGN